MVHFYPPYLRYQNMEIILEISIYAKYLYGANMTDKRIKIMEICEFCNFHPPYLRDKNMEKIKNL